MSTHMIVFGTVQARTRWRELHPLPTTVKSSDNESKFEFVSGDVLELIVISAPAELHRISGKQWRSFAIDESVDVCARGTGLEVELERILREGIV